MIQSDWSGFITELNNLFGEPDLAQASEWALQSLKMQENYQSNMFMIEFAEHAAFMGWNDIAVKIQIFLLSTSEERKKTLAKSLMVRVEVPRTCNNGSESLLSKSS